MHILLPKAEKLFTSLMRGMHFWLGMSALVVLALLTTIHVTGRYVFNQPVPGFVELSTLLQITAISMAGPFSMVYGRHIAVGFLLERFSDRVQAIVSFFTYCLCLIFTCSAAWQAFYRGGSLMRRAQTTEIVHIPVWPFLYLIAVCWVLFSVAIIFKLIRYGEIAMKGGISE
jgi:TRAP-type C4-dicarboxylate transport system permease small subunit